jgi:hypothetical protein
MTLLLVDGFDHYNTTQAPEKWDLWTSATIGSSDGRYYGNSLNCSATTVGPRKVVQTGETYNELIVGFSLYVTNSTSSSIFQFYNSANVSNGLILQHDGIERRLEVFQGSLLMASKRGSIQLNTWNYVEIRVKFGFFDGEVELRINGEVVGVVTNVETIGSSSLHPSADGFRLFRQRFDDLYMLTTSGTSNTDFLGDVTIDTRFPGANGLTNLWQASGASNNFEAVDENPADDDTTYVTTNAANNTDFYVLFSLNATTGSIKGIGMTGKCRRETAGGRRVAFVGRSGGMVSDDSLEHVLDTTYDFFQTVVENNPGTGSPWTITEFNNGEFGVRLKG